MSEELLQRDLVKNPEKIGKWDFYNIGATSVKALKEYGIIHSRVDYGKNERKKVDALIVQQKNVIAVVEYKKPSEFKTETQKKKAIDQEIEVARALKSKIIIATDTKNTVWVNAITGKKIKDEQGNDIKDLFDSKNEKIIQLIEKIDDSIHETNNQLKDKKFINPIDLAKSVWQDIWSVTGATPENSLYTFVELFIFKYLSDLGVLKGNHNFYTLMKMYDDGNTENEVLEHYAQIIRKKIKVLFPHGKFDNTTIINGTVFANKGTDIVKGHGSAFKKILEKFNKYGKLENIEPDFKSQLFESFLKESHSTKNLGQFFTPLKVIRAITEIAKDEIKPGSKICDPACGVGKFLLEPISKKLNEFFPIENNVLKPKIEIHGFDKGFDKDEQKTIILAKANMLIYFSDLIKENTDLTDQFAKLFNDSFILKTNSILGTLSDPVESYYDLILTNPPYVTSGSSNLKEEIKKDGILTNYFKVNAMGVEGLFMEWIINALKPGGKAFIVVPDGIFNRQNDKNLRQFILEECYIEGIISLPLNTFFAVSKKTYILVITKKENKNDFQKHPVFTYLASEIGESRDKDRFDIEQNDLQEAVILFNQFKGAKEYFKTYEKRCKIQPINKFKENIKTSWIIDKWWSEGDKIKLGIIEKQKKVTLLEFASIVEDIADSMKGLQEEIKEISKKKSEINYKSFTVKNLFNLKKGLSKYTKNYGNQNKGKYPVYSASNIAPLTYINSFDFNGEYLTWATNGFAGYVKVISDKFSINGDRGLLKPKQKNINIKYVKYKLEPILRDLAKGRKGEKGENEFTKVYPSMISDIKIDFPVNNSGEIDIHLQSEIVEKFVFIEEIKEKVKEYKQQISDLNIEMASDYEYIDQSISKIFNLQDGFAFPSSIYTAESTDIKLIRIQDVNKKSTPKIVRIPKTYKFHNENKFKVKKGDFLLSLSGAAGFNLIKWEDEEGYLNQRISKVTIKEDYKAFFIDGYEEILIEQVHTELNMLGKGANNNLTKRDILGIKLKLPIDKDRKFDLQAQKEISEKYKKIENIKTAINKELDKISEIEADI